MSSFQIASAATSRIRRGETSKASWTCVKTIHNATATACKFVRTTYRRSAATSSVEHRRAVHGRGPRLDDGEGDGPALAGAVRRPPSFDKLVEDANGNTEFLRGGSARERVLDLIEPAQLGDPALDGRLVGSWPGFLPRAWDAVTYGLTRLRAADRSASSSAHSAMALAASQPFASQFGLRAPPSIARDETAASITATSQPSLIRIAATSLAYFCARFVIVGPDDRSASG